jgi:hypothetical protein
MADNTMALAKVLVDLSNSEGLHPIEFEATMYGVERSAEAIGVNLQELWDAFEAIRNGGAG